MRYSSWLSNQMADDGDRSGTLVPIWNVVCRAAALLRITRSIRGRLGGPGYGLKGSPWNRFQRPSNAESCTPRPHVSMHALIYLIYATERLMASCCVLLILHGTRGGRQTTRAQREMVDFRIQSRPGFPMQNRRVVFGQYCPAEIKRDSMQFCLLICRVYRFSKSSWLASPAMSQWEGETRRKK